MNEGALMTRPFVFLLGGNDKPSVFHIDSDALACLESRLLNPPPGEFEPRVKRRFGSLPVGFLRAAIASRFLNGHEAFRNVWTCFKIGIRHDQLQC